MKANIKIENSVSYYLLYIIVLLLIFSYGNYRCSNKKFKDPLEMIHFADLPAQSGLGASSSFTVGLINGLKALQGDLN